MCPPLRDYLPLSRKQGEGGKWKPSRRRHKTRSGDRVIAVTRSCLLGVPPSRPPPPQSLPSPRAEWYGRARRSASRSQQTTPALLPSIRLPDRTPAPVAACRRPALLSEKHFLRLQKAR